MWMLPLPADLRERFLMLQWTTFSLIQLQCQLMLKRWLNLHIIPRLEKLTNSNSHIHVRLSEAFGRTPSHLIFWRRKRGNKINGRSSEVFKCIRNRGRIKIYYNLCFSFHSPTLKVLTVMVYNLLEEDVSVDLERKQPNFFHGLTHKEKRLGKNLKQSWKLTFL